jgi:uncharacterized protein (TIRG00374 family)
VSSAERQAPARQRRTWAPRTVRHLAELMVVVLIVEVFVLPEIGGTHKALHQLSHVNPFLPLAGLVAEVLALLTYFELTRTLIPPESDPGFASVSRIQLSTLALSHCVPGGNAMGYSLGYRLLTRAGVSGTDTGFALATQGLGSAVVLNVIFWLALALSLPFYGLQPVYLVAAIAGLVLMAFIAALLVLLTKGDKRAMRVVRAVSRRLRFMHPETLPRLFGQLVARVEEMGHDRRRLGRVLALAGGNWLFDAGSLFLFVGAFGHWTNPVAVLVAYGVANILAAIPITPGGLGLVEGSLIPILVGFGVPSVSASLGVLSYRLINFWLPIPVGGAAYLSLKVHPPAEDQAGLAARRALWRARWRWAVELFGRETPTPVAEGALPTLESTLPGLATDDGTGSARSASSPPGHPPGEAPDAGSDPRQASVPAVTRRA